MHRLRAHHRLIAGLRVIVGPLYITLRLAHAASHYGFDLGNAAMVSVGQRHQRSGAVGPGRRPAVIVAIGSHMYRSTIASMPGRWLIPLSAENRATGDHVEVYIESDPATGQVTVAHDFATRT